MTREKPRYVTILTHSDNSHGEGATETVELPHIVGASVIRE
jgi:hypothetical protein